MIKIKLYILSVLLLLVSCTGNKVIDEQITRADSLMETNSDSALVALGMLDSLRKNNPKMSKAQQMRFDLIYAKGMNKGFVDFTTDSVMKQPIMTSMARQMSECWPIICWDVRIVISTTLLHPWIAISRRQSRLIR